MPCLDIKKTHWPPDSQDTLQDLSQNKPSVTQVAEYKYIALKNALYREVMICTETQLQHHE